MPTYDPIASSQYAPDAPVTSEWGAAASENPLAIAEASAGAPYNQTAWHPFDGVTVGDSATGLFYDHAVDGNVVKETANFVDGYEYAIAFIDVSAANTDDLTVELYLATTAFWAGSVAFATGTGSGNYFSGLAELLFARETVRAHPVRPFGVISFATAQKVRNARVDMTLALSGKCYLYRRRAWAL